MSGPSGNKKFLAVLAFVTAVSSTAAGASGNKGTNLEAQRQQLFQQMLKQPGNLETALAYATLSVRVGDLEGAVSTLERMLIFSPGLPRLQMELGVLYYRLGNFDTAQSYLQAAIAGRRTPPVVSRRAQIYLEATEKKLKRFRWSASTFVGLRWQSNANSAPGSRNVTLNGLPVVLGPGSAKKSDFGVVSTSRVHLEYDLESQGDRLELDYVDFANIHFNQSRFDSGVSEVTFGPSFNLGRFNIDDTYASIYGIANGAFLDKSIYFGTLGVGSRIVTRPNRETQFVVRTEFRRQWFNNTAGRPTSTNRNGNEYRVLGQASYLFSRNFRGVVDARVSRKDRRVDAFDYWEYGAQAKFDWAVTPTKLSKEYPWVVTARAGYLYRNYDDPNPLVSATRSQKDNEYWVGGTLKVPLSKSWAIMPKVEYREVTSNNPLQDFKAFTATIGVEFSQ